MNDCFHVILIFLKSKVLSAFYMFPSVLVSVVFEMVVCVSIYLRRCCCNPRGVLKDFLHLMHTGCFGNLFGMLSGSCLSCNKGSALLILSHNFRL